RSRPNRRSAVKRQEVAKLFLKKSTRWSDGREALPVDQSLRSPVRTAFTKDVLAVEGMGQTSAVESYWLQQVYSGRGNPPAVKPTDAERSEEHTSELQSLTNLVCRLLLEKKKSTTGSARRED